MIELKKMGLFHTPKDSDELMAYIEQLPPDDRPMAVAIMGMTWNLCAETVASLQRTPDAD